MPIKDKNLLSPEAEHLELGNVHLNNKNYALALKEQLRNFLMSDEGFIPIEDAIKEADKKWP